MLWVLLALIASACATPEGTFHSALSSGVLQPFTLPVQGLTLAAAQTSNASTAPHVTIYIEGDGLAFAGPGEASVNPTPRHPVALALAQNAARHAAEGQGAEGIIYLARPCQYVSYAGQFCRPAVWTDGRFTADKVSLYKEAITALTANRPTTLVGYSGGAALALAVAKDLPNVTALVTVAGNLTPSAINIWHGYPARPDDIAPLQNPGRLKTLPWLALSGEHDKVIPPALTQQMLADTGPWPCLKTEVERNATHITGWESLNTSTLPMPTCGP